MDDFLYVVHTLSKDAWKQVKKDGKLRCSSGMQGQFPGVYMSLITKKNVDTERLYTGKVVLLFSRRLLEQNNYHVNYIDHNGIITNKTVFRWNLDKFVEYEASIENRYGNEIVFHDDIDLKYLCKVRSRSRSRPLSKTPLETKALPDFTKLPFVSYVDFRWYTGVRVPFYQYSTTPAWIRAMSKVAGVYKRGLSRDQLLNRISKRRVYLHSHREKQDFRPLLEYHHVFHV